MHSILLAVNSGEKHIDNMTQAELLEAQCLALTMSFEERQAFFEYLLKPSVVSFSYAVTAPEWLESDFDDFVWHCVFGKEKKEIDFRVILDDSSLLTDPCNSKILYTFKYFLCVQTHPKFTGGNRLVHSYSRTKINRVISFFDYVLLRNDHFQLSKYGLSLVNFNDLNVFLGCIHIGVHEGVYDHSMRLTRHLKEKAGTISDADITYCMRHFPDVRYISEERSLELTDDDIVRAKVWLWQRGGYGKQRNPKKYNSKILISEMYSKKILAKKLRFPIVPELLGVDRYLVNREFPPVPVRSDKDRGGDVDHGYVDRYKGTIGSLRALSSNEFMGVDDSVLDEFANHRNIGNGVLCEGIKRYRTLPSGVTLKAMRDAFEFTARYSDYILDIVTDTIVEQQRYSGESPVPNIDLVVNRVITKSPSELRIKMWNIRDDHITSEDYFKKFRGNFSLLSLYQVLIGCIQVFIGILMARRSGELIDLAPDCLYPKFKDPHLEEHKDIKFSLTFDNNKSGHAGDRESLTRPIPISGAKLIWKLQKFREQLIEGGVVGVSNGLFQGFTQSGRPRVKMTGDIYYENLNHFCDYFETMTIDIGEGTPHRYYLRQHQFRRFFAMCFFWGSGYDGLDTLRWFLGHTDAEHLWHYITENTPGSVLLGVKAETLVHGLNAGNIEDIELLRELLMRRLGLSSLTIESLASVVSDLEDEVRAGYVKLNAELESLKLEVESKVEFLLSEGVIDLKPTFLTVTNEIGEIVQEVTLVLIIKEVENG